MITQMAGKLTSAAQSYRASATTSPPKSVRSSAPTGSQHSNSAIAWIYYVNIKSISLEYTASLWHTFVYSCFLSHPFPTYPATQARICLFLWAKRRTFESCTSLCSTCLAIWWLSVTEVIHKRTAFQTTETWHSRALVVGNLAIWRQTWYHHTEWLSGWLLQGNTIHPGWVSSIGVLSTNIKKYLAFSGSLPMVLLVYVMRSKYQPNNVRAFVSLFACVFLCYFAWLMSCVFMFLFIDFWLSIAITLTSKYLGLIPGSQLRDINIASTYCVFVAAHPFERHAVHAKSSAPSGSFRRYTARLAWCTCFSWLGIVRDPWMSSKSHLSSFQWIEPSTRTAPKIRNVVCHV